MEGGGVGWWKVGKQRSTIVQGVRNGYGNESVDGTRVMMGMNVANHERKG